VLFAGPKSARFDPQKTFFLFFFGKLRIRLILKAWLIEPYVHNLYQDCALIDLKLRLGPLLIRFKGPMRKLIDVTNISISTEFIDDCFYYL